MNRISWTLWIMISLVAFAYTAYGVFYVEPQPPCSNWARITEKKLKDCLNFRRIN